MRASALAQREVAPRRLAGSAGEMIVHVFLPRGPAAGAALVAHGRNGAVSQDHIRPVIEACLERSLAVIAPDLCNSAANESAGTVAEFTMEKHVADVRTVLAAAPTLAPWSPREPRLIIGHSMGAYAAVRLAAEAAPGTLTGVLALSPVVSGRALIAARRAMGARAIAELRAEVPTALEEWLRHDLSLLARKVKCPAAVIVGEDDTVTPPADAALLASWLPHLVWHDTIPGEHHCPLGKDYARSIGVALDHLVADDAP